MRIKKTAKTEAKFPHVKKLALKSSNFTLKRTLKKSRLNFPIFAPFKSENTQIHAKTVRKQTMSQSMKKLNFKQK